MMKESERARQLDGQVQALTAALIDGDVYKRQDADIGIRNPINGAWSIQIRDRQGTFGA